MDMQYIVRPEDLARVPAGRTIVDRFATPWERNGRGLWTDGTGRERNHDTMVIMRGPVYVLPEDAHTLTLDDLSDAEPGDAVKDRQGGDWVKDEQQEWALQYDEEEYLQTSEDLLSIHGPLIPAPRPGDIYARPVPAMEAAARVEEARPVSFWRRLWNGLVWG